MTTPGTFTAVEIEEITRAAATVANALVGLHVTVQDGGHVWPDEVHALWELAESVKDGLLRLHAPDGAREVIAA